MGSFRGRAARAVAIGSFAAMLLAGGNAARADGYLPFYGYSAYFGQPATYFTPEDTIHQTTTAINGDYGFGTRRYYRGGPFWHYQPNTRSFTRSSRRDRRVVLRRKY